MASRKPPGAAVAGWRRRTARAPARRTEPACLDVAARPPTALFDVKPRIFRILLGARGGGGGRRWAARAGAVLGSTEDGDDLRTQRGEPLDSLARDLGVTAATLVQWRKQFLAGRPGRPEESPGG